jgi:hypothetical protein
VAGQLAVVQRSPQIEGGLVEQALASSDVNQERRFVLSHEWHEDLRDLRKKRRMVGCQSELPGGMATRLARGGDRQPPAIGVEVQEAVRGSWPDAAHVATEGFACPKGLKQHRMLDSPDRLRWPLRRTGSGFARVSWDEALADIGARVRRLVSERDPDAIAMYGR